MTRPNILMIMVDQLYYPQKGYGSAGFDDQIKAILSFVDEVTADNKYSDVFPGFMKLREYSKVLVDHTIAESACIPSRASIQTGQYGPRTGVTQTDGLFKPGEARNFPWLRANGTPTIGDWMRELGYTTHYFGKWHVSDPPEHTLQGFGYDDWELSWPEPHGSLSNNLGSFRDYQFASLACSFLTARGLGIPYTRNVSTLADEHPELSEPQVVRPFFAVCSFTNPHDIAAYPGLPRGLTNPPQFGLGESVPIPQNPSAEQLIMSVVPKTGTYSIPLNPNNLPQACATASPTQDENLLTNNKPRAQYDYSIKLGLGLAAKTGLSIASGSQNPGNALTSADVLAKAIEATFAVAVPFQLREQPDEAATAFLQYYVYMISMVDRHILQVLDTLERTGLRDNTLVVFASDHGEYGAAHSMMMEKWHGAYQEVVNVPVVFSNKNLINGDQSNAIPIHAQTSHIDILPTLLAFAGATPELLDRARERLSMTHQAAPLPGANLKPVLDAGKGPVIGPDGKQREAILFATDDMITEPLPLDDDPHNKHSWEEYAVYCGAVEQLRTSGGGPTHVNLPQLAPGPVLQPNHVRAVRAGRWKLVRYCDPWSAKPVPDEWELYDLHTDPIENVNLLKFDQPFPSLIDPLPANLQLTSAQLLEVVTRLGQQLSELEQQLLSPYPSEFPSSGSVIAK
jgi:arylsulfatase A-like enzyme